MARLKEFYEEHPLMAPEGAHPQPEAAQAGAETVDDIEEKYHASDDIVALGALEYEIGYMGKKITECKKKKENHDFLLMKKELLEDRLKVGASYTDT